MRQHLPMVDVGYGASSAGASMRAIRYWLLRSQEYRFALRRHKSHVLLSLCLLQCKLLRLEGVRVEMRVVGVSAVAKLMVGAKTCGKHVNGPDARSPAAPTRAQVPPAGPALAVA